jgi:hypothetical protein
MVRYTFNADESYLSEAVFRKRVQDSLPFRWERIMLGCGAFMFALTLTATMFDLLPIWLWCVSLVTAIYFTISPSLDRRLIARRLQQLPTYGKSMSVTLDWDSCADSVGVDSQRIEWQSITKALRLVDGFLLFIGAEKSVWLPDSALAEGTTDEANLLLKNHVHGYAG